MRIDQLMSRDVKACSDRDSLAKGARHIQDNDGRCAPVVDRHGHVVGLLAERDVSRATATLQSPPFETPLSVVMQRSPVLALPHEPVEKAHERMRQARVRCLVVVGEDGTLLGLLSLDDLARQAMQALRLDGRPFWAEQVAQTLASCPDRSGSRPAAA